METRPGKPRGHDTDLFEFVEDCHLALHHASRDCSSS
jgi:hypothetical protein